MSFGLTYYYDKPKHHRLKKSEHNAIAGCFQGAVTMAIFGRV